MNIIDVEQGSPEWLACRAGIPTASELDNLVSNTGVIRQGAMPNSYLCVKLAERWLGGPMQSFGGGVMEQGTILEAEARPWYEFAHNVTVRTVGFITRDGGDIGCSPDGLILDAAGGIVGGLEIKCPQPPNHVKWLLAGVVPPDHLFQCLGGMLVTGLPWTFVSYCRGFPALVVEVRADPDLLATIRDAINEFTGRMDVAWGRLVTLNGGPPSRPERPASSTASELSDSHPF